MRKTVPVYRHLVFWVAILTLSACSRSSFVIPVEPTAKAQFTYALRMEEMYLSPLRKESKEDDFKLAMAAFKKVIKEFPDSKDVRPLAEMHIAFLRDKNGQTRKALGEYEKLLKQYPEKENIQINCLYGAAVLHERLKHFDEAKEYYKQILEKFGQRTDGSYPEIVKQARFRYLRANKK